MTKLNRETARTCTRCIVEGIDVSLYTLSYRRPHWRCQPRRP